VILGAAFGGLAAGLTVRRLVPDAEIVLLEQAPFFVFPPAALRYVFGQAGFGQIARGYGALAARRLPVIRATVVGLERARRRVLTTEGPIAYDRLLVATGLRLAPEAIPGLSVDSPVNVSPYDGGGALVELRRRIAGFRGGHVIVGAPEGPYRCPPAPYEYALLWARHLRARGLKGRVTLLEPRSRPTPPSIAAGLLQALEAHRERLTYEPFTRVLSVDPGARTVETEAGRLRFDLLSLVPPHRIAPFLVGEGLGEPFVEVDLRSFRTLADERVYAVGDVADTPYARTASTAVSAGRIAGHALARAFGAPAGLAGPPENVCFPQVSATSALRIHTTWAHEVDAAGVVHAKAEGEVDNRPTRESLRRRHAWEARLMGELFGGP
jgi:sulfide dehydrogenase [flavocytochrome c] flavoprotein chain